MYQRTCPPCRAWLYRALFMAVFFCGPLYAQQETPPSGLPLLDIEDLVYEGAFRLPAGDFGASSLNYSEGPIAYNPARHSLFIVGHSHHQAIAEFAVPGLVNSTALADLNMAEAPLQAFTTVLDRAPDGNPQDLNRIGGMAYVDGPGGTALLVNAYEYYDAPGDNTHTTLSVRDAGDLPGSGVDAFFRFEGGAGHTSGWISPIPAAWRPALGGTHLTGQSSGIPIIGRTSVGPSAFAFDPMTIVGAASVEPPVPTATLLDFSLQHPLREDLSNTSGTNDCWTHLSRVTYGLIVPGTRTYLTVGYSGGHASGVCYKCTQNDGTLCGGYCAPDAGDYYQYYWLWDVNDLVAVRAGQLNPYDVRPYAYGEFPTPFQNGTRQIGGGAFDAATGLLYLTIQKGDRDQGTYANPPVVVAYRLGAGAVSTEEPAPGLPEAYRLTPPYPNPFVGRAQLTLSVRQRQEVSVAVYDVLGHRVGILFRGTMEANQEHALTFDASTLPGGIYMVRATGRAFTAVHRVAHTR